MSISEVKRARLNALSTSRGVIAALAIDQRGSLQKALAAAANVPTSSITAGMLSEFKCAVSRILTPYASAILLDPEYGLDAARTRAPDAGLLLAYEKSGYDNARPGRLPDLLENVSVNRIAGWGADAVKLLLYYTPFEAPGINEIKHIFVERVGAECRAHGIPFFLELLGYDEAGGDEKGIEYARKKPRIVTGSVAEFSRVWYGVDVFKLEVPFNATFVSGSGSYKGQQAHSKAEAMDLLRAVAAVSTKPFIYLSAGVGNEQFVESLEWAGEAGGEYSGVLCGRATWKGGIAVYATSGLRALEDWLSEQGVRNITAVNRAIGQAQPWQARLLQANDRPLAGTHSN